MKQLNLKYKWKFFLMMELFTLGIITFVFTYLFALLYPKHSLYELPMGFLLSLVITIFIVTGFSCLVVQTAGSSTPYAREGEIPGLSIQTAEQLREELTKQVESLRGGGVIKLLSTKR